MKKYIGGYSILDLASTTIYADALGALKQDKPVLVYDNPECYFADTIKATTIDDEPVVQITKGGKTITINDVNAVSSEGQIAINYKPLYLHNINLSWLTYGDFEIEYISSKETYTKAEFKKLLEDKFNSNTKILSMNGTYKSSYDNNVVNNIFGIYSVSESLVALVGETITINFNGSSVSISDLDLSGVSWTDVTFVINSNLID